MQGESKKPSSPQSGGMKALNNSGQNRCPAGLILLFDGEAEAGANPLPDERKQTGILTFGL
jgi:hypothetical protein